MVNWSLEQQRLIRITFASNNEFSDGLGVSFLIPAGLDIPAQSRDLLGQPMDKAFHVVSHKDPLRATLCAVRRAPTV